MRWNNEGKHSVTTIHQKHRITNFLTEQLDQNKTPGNKYSKEHYRALLVLVMNNLNTDGRSNL